jgi:predicted nucleic acid-binding protein
MRYLLDTNIISNFTKLVPAEPLVAWMADQFDDELFIAALTLAELRRGVLETPAGKRRNQLDAWFSGPQGPQALFAGRILPFDERAGIAWAELMAEGRASGRPRSGLDTIIAAIAVTNDCVVVTDNERDFAGIEIFNPIRGAS